MADSCQKRSPIWKHYVVCEEDDSKARCILCNENVSRGGSKRKSCNTTNLWKHLEQYHKDIYGKGLEVGCYHASNCSCDGNETLTTRVVRIKCIEHFIDF